MSGMCGIRYRFGAGPQGRPRPAQAVGLGYELPTLCRPDGVAITDYATTYPGLRPGLTWVAPAGLQT
jgi:hypothetical protein